VLHDYALYKSTFTLLYFTRVTGIVVTFGKSQQDRLTC